MIKFECNYCGNPIVVVRDEAAGQQGTCHRCSKKVTIPTPSRDDSPESRTVTASSRPDNSETNLWRRFRSHWISLPLLAGFVLAILSIACFAIVDQLLVPQQGWLKEDRLRIAHKICAMILAACGAISGHQRKVDGEAENFWKVTRTGKIIFVAILLTLGVSIYWDGKDAERSNIESTENRKLLANATSNAAESKEEVVGLRKQITEEKQAAEIRHTQLRKDNASQVEQIWELDLRLQALVDREVANDAQLKGYQAILDRIVEGLKEGDRSQELLQKLKDLEDRVGGPSGPPLPLPPRTNLGQSRVAVFDFPPRTVMSFGTLPQQANVILGISNGRGARLLTCGANCHWELGTPGSNEAAIVADHGNSSATVGGARFAVTDLNGRPATLEVDGERVSSYVNEAPELPTRRVKISW